MKIVEHEDTRLLINPAENMSRKQSDVLYRHSSTEQILQFENEHM